MVSEFYAKEGVYQGEQAILLKFGQYSAVMLPRVGGNLISFRDDESGSQLLREPTEDEFEEFLARPMIHGIPILFPPNRFDAGRFTFNGRVYQFPVNEADLGNHIHGFVYNYPWQVDHFGANESESSVTVSLHFDQNHPSYEHFPHTFTLSVIYTLSGAGLTQRMSVTNEGPDELPFMLGYHTTVNAPFAPGSGPDDVTLHVTIGDRWELDGRMLPTGRTLPLSEGEERIKAGTGNSYFGEMDNHYTAEPQNGRNAMMLTDNKAKLRFVYEAGLKYKHWMVWNNKISQKYFCPEPQTIMNNAPNSKLSREQTGLFGLKPGETWSETCRMYIESI